MQTFKRFLMESDTLSYEALQRRQFKVSRADAAIVRQRTIAAVAAKDALSELVRAIGVTNPAARPIEQARRAVEAFIIPVALLKVVADDEPFFTD